MFYSNPEKSSTTKENEHTPSGYSLFQCSFNLTKSSLDYYRAKDCIKTFWKDIKEYETEIMNYEKKIDTINYEENKSYEKQKGCYICKKNINTDKNFKNAFKLYHKVRDHCHYTGKYRGTAHNICNLRYKPPREIPVVFPNDCT